MGDVKRYEIFGHDGYAEPDEDGFYVTHDDYAALQARVAELEAGDAEATRLFIGAQKRTRKYKARAEAAEALLSEAVKAFRAITELEATGYSKAKAINLAADLARKAIASIVKEDRG
jgi:hypothetical protein